MQPIARGILHSAQQINSIPRVRRSMRYQYVAIDQPLGEVIHLGGNKQRGNVLHVYTLGRVFFAYRLREVANIHLK